MGDDELIASLIESASAVKKTRIEEINECDNKDEKIPPPMKQTTAAEKKLIIALFGDESSEDEEVVSIIIYLSVSLSHTPSHSISLFHVLPLVRHL